MADVHRALDDHDLPLFQRVRGLATEKVADRIRDDMFLIGLGKKQGAGGEITLTEDRLSRCHDQKDRGPPLANVFGEPQPIHSARHVHVGEHDPYVASRAVGPEAIGG